MDRKQFLKTSLGCCGAAMAGNLTILAQEKAPDVPLTDCSKRVVQGQKVIRRLLGELDRNVDQGLREKIMESCGRQCFEGAHGPRAAEAPKPEDVTKFLDGMRKHLGEQGVERVGDEMIVYFKYTANPRGLKVSEGYCLCPILEDAPKDISPTFCHCSVGYVREIFERRVGKPVQVELLDSVLRGGKGCNFKVRFKA
jgi:hypothetical protein